MALPKAGYSARYSCRDRLTILLIDRGVGLRLSTLLHEGKGLQVSSLTESFFFLSLLPAASTSMPWGPGLSPPPWPDHRYPGVEGWSLYKSHDQHLCPR